MSWAEIEAAVLSGNWAGFQPSMPSPLSVVLNAGQIWLADDSYIEVFEPTQDQQEATNWEKVPFDGSLPPR